MTASAPEVWFYHLQRTPLAPALADLLERCMAKGMRAIVRGADEARLAQLDVQLWAGAGEAFLPHGLDGPGAARQPVLLTSSQANPNGARALFLVHGAAPEALAGYERACVLFEGADGEGLVAARSHWRALKAAGGRGVYWRQGEKGWEKQS